MRSFQGAPLRAKCYATGDVAGTEVATIPATTSRTFAFLNSEDQETPVGTVVIQNESDEDLWVQWDSDAAITGDADSWPDAIVKAGETRPYTVYQTKLTVHNLGASAVQYENSDDGEYDKTLIVVGWPAE